jgi:hypothetical protein
MIARMKFDRMRVSDLIANPMVNLDKPFCSQLSLEAQLEIASATVLTGQKSTPA